MLVLSQLKDRTLYDIVFRLPKNRKKWVALSENCLYSKKSWDNCGLMHATDLHASRRLESFRAMLPKEGRRAFVNFNDGIRAMIEKANDLHRRGRLDAILATGDLVDYIYENDDKRTGDGNFGFLKNLLLGRVKAETGKYGPRLHIPIFMTLGNHDYRPHPYKLVFKIEVPGKNKPISQHKSMNIGFDESKIIQGGRPTISKGAANKMAEIDKEIVAYHRTLARDRSYIVRLGPHRVAMLDSRWDVGVVSSNMDGLRTWMGYLSENEANFVDGHPNCAGPTKNDVALVKRALTESKNGAVIVGIHAPLLNLAGNEYPYYLRETLRPSAAQAELVDFHYRNRGWTDAVPQTLDNRLYVPPSWLKKNVGHVKEGNSNGLDFGVSKGQAEELIDACLGKGGSRKATIVLSGHVHKNVENRVERRGEGRRYFMDFYTESPSRYYWTRIGRKVKDEEEHVHVRVSKKAKSVSSAVTVRDHRGDYSADSWKRVTTPDYADPLASAALPRAWWQKHAPLSRPLV